jgi:hypothetical protein
MDIKFSSVPRVTNIQKKPMLWFLSFVTNLETLSTIDDNMLLADGLDGKSWEESGFGLTEAQCQNIPDYIKRI